MLCLPILCQDMSATEMKLLEREAQNPLLLRILLTRDSTNLTVSRLLTVQAESRGAGLAGSPQLRGGGEKQSRISQMAEGGPGGRQAGRSQGRPRPGCRASDSPPSAPGVGLRLGAQLDSERGALSRQPALQPSPSPSPLCPEHLVKEGETLTCF